MFAETESLQELVADRATRNLAGVISRCVEWRGEGDRSNADWHAAQRLLGRCYGRTWPAAWTEKLLQRAAACSTLLSVEVAIAAIASHDISSHAYELVLEKAKAILNSQDSFDSFMGRTVWDDAWQLKVREDLDAGHGIITMY